MEKAKNKMDLGVLAENRFPPVRVWGGGGDFIFYFIFVRLGGPWVSKKIKYRLADFGRGGVPAPFFFWRPP